MQSSFFLVGCLLALVTILSAQWFEAKIPVGNNPWALVYNSTNNKVYCANDVSNTVTVIDGASDTVIKIIAVGGGSSAFT